MTTDFSSLNQREELVQAITGLGYSEPTPIQSAIIPVMLAGSDVIGQAQTGTGKTAAFALPILQNFTPQRHVQALVLAPTRELALQVADSMTVYGKHLNVRILAVYGGQPYGPQISRLNRGVDVVVGTPGRMLDLIERSTRELGVTVLMATHSPEAAAIAGRQVHLRDGRMVDPLRSGPEPRLPRAAL